MPTRRTDNPHRTADLRSVALHREVARAILKEPDLLERARRRVETWLDDGGPVARDYALRWKELLSGSEKELGERLVDPGDEMQALRQCSPFAGALDARTRWRILRVVRAGDPR